MGQTDKHTFPATNEPNQWTWLERITVRSAKLPQNGDQFACEAAAGKSQ